MLACTRCSRSRHQVVATPQLLVGIIGIKHGLLLGANSIDPSSVTAPSYLNSNARACERAAQQLVQGTHVPARSCAALPAELGRVSDAGQWWRAAATASFQRTLTRQVIRSVPY